MTENWLCMCIYSVSIIGIKNRLVLHLGFGSPLSRRDKLMSTWWVPFSQQQGGVFPVDEGSGLLGAWDPGGTVPAAAWAMAAQRVLHDGESWNRSVSHGCCEQSETFQQRERSVSWYMYTVSYIYIKIAFVTNRTVPLASYWKKHKTNHITPLFQFLHWLPIQQRIQYKRNTLCYNYITGTSPSYLCDCLQLYTLSHTPHSASHTLTSLSLQIPCTRLSTVGSCAFSVFWSIYMEWSPPSSLTETLSGLFEM